MASKLFLGNDEYITVDRIFVDGGMPAQYGLSGGLKVLLDPGQRACPTIYQVGTQFFFQDGRQPVLDAELVERHPGMPPDAKRLALAFIQSQRMGGAKPLKPTHVAPKRSHHAAKPLTPPRLPGRVVIDSEEALAAATGGSTA